MFSHHVFIFLNQMIAGCMYIHACFTVLLTKKNGVALKITVWYMELHVPSLIFSFSAHVAVFSSSSPAKRPLLLPCLTLLWTYDWEVICVPLWNSSSANDWTVIQSLPEGSLLWTQAFQPGLSAQCAGLFVASEPQGSSLPTVTFI